jgi:TPR repeat protein
VKTLKNLSDLNDETMSMINNQLAIDALEAGNTKLGIEILQTSVKDGRNAVALYNLGICYERGVGVEQDRAKVNDSPSKSNDNPFYFRHVITIGKHHF